MILPQERLWEGGREISLCTLSCSEQLPRGVLIQMKCPEWPGIQTRGSQRHRLAGGNLPCANIPSPGINPPAGKGPCEAFWTPGGSSRWPMALELQGSVLDAPTDAPSESLLWPFSLAFHPFRMDAPPSPTYGAACRRSWLPSAPAALSLFPPSFKPGIFKTC